jgi:hypothetical protein
MQSSTAEETVKPKNKGGTSFNAVAAVQSSNPPFRWPAK